PDPILHSSPTRRSSDLDEVERATPRLHVLINNAGIGSGMPDGRERRESRDGHELRLAVNHLAGFLLTMRLLPLLRRSVPARVVLDRKSTRLNSSHLGIS